MRLAPAAHTPCRTRLLRPAAQWTAVRGHAAGRHSLIRASGTRSLLLPYRTWSVQLTVGRGAEHVGAAMRRCAALCTSGSSAVPLVAQRAGRANGGECFRIRSSSSRQRPVMRVAGRMVWENYHAPCPGCTSPHRNHLFHWCVQTALDVRSFCWHRRGLRPPSVFWMVPQGTAGAIRSTTKASSSTCDLIHGMRLSS